MMEERHRLFGKVIDALYSFKLPTSKRSLVVYLAMQSVEIQKTSNKFILEMKVLGDQWLMNLQIVC